MSCLAAIVKDIVTLDPELSVENALKLLKEKKISSAPVVDKDGKLIGLFSLKILLSNLIPVSFVVADGVPVDIKVGAAPGVSKRLKKVMPLQIEEILDRKFQKVRPDDPLWEGVSLITRGDGPVAVIDISDKFIGLLTYASVVEQLETLNDSNE